MIVITVKKEEICTIEIEGHANYAEYGKDIVCAAVSVLFQTLVLHLRQENKLILFDDKKIKRLIFDLKNKESALLFNHFMIGIRAIEKDYSKYIRIKNDSVKTIK